MRASLAGHVALLGALLLVGTLTQAQVAPPTFSGAGGGLRAPRGPRAPAAQAALTGQSAAPIALTGYWVSVITEDWRWRMLTPAKADTASVPLNPAGLKIANEFDAAKYGSPWSQRIDCRAYYMAGLMRMPERVHITWASPDALKIETDWGEQTRTLHFQKSQLPGSGPTPQGSSYAQWVLPPSTEIGEGGILAPPQKVGTLRVVTDNLTPGWLRRNGVPYGAKTRVTEYFETFQVRNQAWFDVTTVVVDPEYLVAPFITSSDFRQEPDGSKWAPHPCMNVQAEQGG